MFIKMASETKINLQKRTENAKGRVVKLTHIPDGFFDMEIYQYFSQFGQIKRVRVPRSKKVRNLLELLMSIIQGKFLKIAYVFFVDPEVARIAAESMNNYLMFDTRVRSVVLEDKIPSTILMGPRLIRNNPLPDRAKKALAKKMSAKMGKEDAEKFKVCF
jgi:nucleolar protein 15